MFFKIIFKIKNTRKSNPSDGSFLRVLKASDFSFLFRTNIITNDLLKKNRQMNHLQM